MPPNKLQTEHKIKRTLIAPHFGLGVANEIKQIGWELQQRTEHMQQLENETKV